MSTEVVLRKDLSAPALQAHGGIRVLIVADVRLYREALAASLASRPRLTVVGSVGGREEALALARSEEPDVAVLDTGTRDSLSIAHALSEASMVKVVAFPVDDIGEQVLACAEAGVAGFLPCESSTDQLVATIESVSRGELPCSPRMAAVLLRRVGSLVRGTLGSLSDAPLTRRELEIVAFVDNGLSNKEIACRLNIAVATVKNHVHNILEKLQVSSRAAAAAQLRLRLPGRRFHLMSSDPSARRDLDTRGVRWPGSDL